MKCHNGDKTYHCNDCGKDFARKDIHKQHMMIHTGEKPYQCDQCDKVFSRNSHLKRHLKSHTGDNPYTCSQCKKAFKRNEDLKQHMNIHTGEKAYKCKHCDMAFLSKYQLKCHIRSHTGERPYQCSQCDEAFSRNDDLKRHMSSHTGDKPYHCVQCVKTFSHNDDLEQHIKIHTVERPYKCNQCDKAFKYNPQLKHHLNTHTGERPYQCSQCEKTFQYSHNLTCHIKTHTGERPYQCSQCDKTFTTKAILKRHSNIHSGERPYQCNQCKMNFKEKDILEDHIRIHSVEKTCQCSKCDKAFLKAYDLKRHMIAKHGDSLNVSPRDKTECLDLSCKQTFFHHSKLIEHMKKTHDTDIKIMDLDFISWEDFFKWKEAQQEKDWTFYSKQTSTKKGTTGVYSYYHCQSDGHSMPHRSKGDERRKTTRRNRKGVIKQNKFCPSKIICKAKDEATGPISVTYIHTHNHEVNFKNTEHQPIPYSVLEDIKSMVSLGASVDYIHNGLRDGKDSRDNREESYKNIQRKHTISKRQISNIAYKMRVNRRMHPDDATSLYYIIKELMNEDYNSVLLYKPQREDFVIGPPIANENKMDKIDIKDNFILGLQTKQQLQMLQKHASKIVCIDSTHCTNKYDFKLVTMVVPDEFGKGYPVAHLICNQENEQTLQYFFEAIKKRCDDNFKINAIMTDDDNTGWAAFRKVFGEDVNHFLCKWHIHRSWNRKLHQLLPHDQNLQSELYHASIVLMEEKNSDKFHFMAENFRKAYENVCEDYVDYFERYYLSRPKKWAMCYRNFPHGNTDTNMYVESFHNKLKTHYMKRRRNRRLDDLVNMLLQIEKDDSWRHNKDVWYKKDEIIQKCSSRHERGIEIKDNAVMNIEESKWSVKSQTDNAVIYEVHLLIHDCNNDLCFDKCIELSCIGLCSHTYICTCSDKINNLCKHIHKVHSLRVRSYQVPRFIDPEFQNSNYVDPTNKSPLTFFHTEISKSETNEKDCEFKLKRAKRALDDISNHLNDKDVTSVNLTHILAVLEDLNRNCKTVQENKKAEQGKFDETKDVAPNSTLQLQPIFRTSLKRKKRKDLSGPSLQVHKAISTNLMEGWKCSSDDEGTTDDEDSNEHISPKIIKLDTEVSHIVSEASTPAQNSNIGFRSVLPTNIDPTEIILCNGPNNLNLLNLKSLEPMLTKSELKHLNQAEKNYRIGWLYDVIIDSYFWNLSIQNKGVLLCSTVVTNALARKHNGDLRMGRLWDANDISSAHTILAPWNPSGNHWVLVVIFLSSSNAYFLDPLSNDRNLSNEILIKAQKMFDLLIKNKFGESMQLNWSVPNHTLQNDGYNCGVFICWYGERLLSHESITDDVNVINQREVIFNQIVGNCLKDSNEYSMHKDKYICRECQQSDGSNWIECNRCHQWHHCSCVDLTIEDANRIAAFHCP